MGTGWPPGKSYTDKGLETYEQDAVNFSVIFKRSFVQKV
jgi:hypothetical protein